MIPPEDTSGAERRHDDRVRGAALAATALSDHDLLVTLVADVRHNTGMMETLVARSEFTPVRNIAYGMVGLIVTLVVGALVALVVQQ